MEEPIKKSHIAPWLAWLVCWPPSNGFLALISVVLGVVWWGFATDFGTLEIFFPGRAYLAFLVKECASETIIYIAVHTILYVALIYGPLGFWWLVFFMILRSYQPARNHWLLSVAVMSALAGLFLYIFIPNF